MCVCVLVNVCVCVCVCGEGGGRGEDLKEEARNGDVEGLGRRAILHGVIIFMLQNQDWTYSRTNKIRQTVKQTIWDK